MIKRRELSRIFGQRQLLARRVDLDPYTAAQQLAGIQAQTAAGPYVGLWSRLRDFRCDSWTELLQDRRIVRANLMRATIHAVTVADFQMWRNAVQPALLTTFRGECRALARSGDVPAVLAKATELLPESPLTRAELGRSLQPFFSDVSPADLAFCARLLLPVVQLPPAGEWGKQPNPKYRLAEDWIGGELAPAQDGIRDMVRRYLHAFGPASIQDFQAWSGLTRTKGCFTELRAELTTVTDEQGRTLYDLREAERKPTGSLPVRFLPEWDNVQYGLADRARINPLGRVTTFGLLVDGTLRGSWKMNGAELRIQSWQPLSGAQFRAVTAEARRLANFLVPDSEGATVRIETSA